MRVLVLMGVSVMCHSEPSSALDSQFAIESPPLFSRCNSLLTFKLSRPRSSLATFSQYQPRSSAYYNLLASALTPQPSRLPAIAQSSSFQQLLPPCCPTTLSRPRGRILTRHRFLTGAPPQSRSYIVAAPPALSHCRRALPPPPPPPPPGPDLRPASKTASHPDLPINCAKLPFQSDQAVDAHG